MMQCPNCGVALHIVAVSAAWRHMPVEELELSTRSIRTLHALGAITVGAAAELSDAALLAYPNFGKHSLWEVRNAIANARKSNFSCAQSGP